MEQAICALGVCYYPEHWPSSMWRQDAKNMRDLGLSWVRIAEFSWSRIEPKPGQMDWDWLDEAIDILAQHELRIVLCTPTATPPRWLIDAMPDMLPVDAAGQVRRFGSRRHYAFAHQGYRAESRRITRQIAERYGQHAAVQAWQTDNEYGCHGTVRSYCAATADAFRAWLEDRYGTMEALNDAWGTVFWSMTYQSFQQIEPPLPAVTEINPAHELDFRRCCSDLVASFNQEQVEILKAHSPGRPISHNFMGAFNDFDARDTASDLTIAAWDSYPLGFLQNRLQSGSGIQRSKDTQIVPIDDPMDCLRVGCPDFQAFHHDLYRAMGRLWVMEQQPGPVNWARYNPVPAQGAVRLWTWEAAAHGADVVSYFRWRQAPFGQEQMHAGLRLRNDQPAAAYAEIQQVREELHRVGPLSTVRGSVALIFDYCASWMSEIDGQTDDFNYLEWALAMYRAARQNGANVDVLGVNDPLDGYQLILAPALLHAPEDFLTRCRDSGAKVLFGPRTGQKTTSFQVPESLSADALTAMTGFQCHRVDALPSAYKTKASWGDVQGHVSLWQELGSYEQVHPVGTMTSDYGTDETLPLMTQGSHGYYLRAWPCNSLLEALMADVMEEADIQVVRLPSLLRVRKCAEAWVFTNYGSSPAEIPSALEGEFILGDRVVDPVDVAVLRR